MRFGVIISKFLPAFICLSVLQQHNISVKQTSTHLMQIKRAKYPIEEVRNCI